MTMAFKTFDTQRLKLKPLSAREHDLTISAMAPLKSPDPVMNNPDLETIACRMLEARRRGAAIIMMMGAHVIRAGMGRFLIDLMQRGYITHFGLNGAGAIHDYEFALIGATTESVAKYISEGQFGLWQETGYLNEIAKVAAREKIGFGEALGREISQNDYPYKETSLFAAGYRLQVPVTIHAAIGQDIIHEHPNCDGAALGAASYHDFLVFANSVENLQGGVFLNVGTAVMGPEVYLKALSMSRNVAHQEGRVIRDFTTAVFDIRSGITADFHNEPKKSEPEYYFRCWKTILVRTVRDGGESFYVRGEHSETIPALWHFINECEKVG